MGSGYAFAAPSWHERRDLIMPVITLYFDYLERLTGADRKTILSRLPMLGTDIERIEEDHCDVEFFPNRPDLFSVEGVARALRGFMGLEAGLSEYRVTPSGMRFTIDPALAMIRPYLGSAVIRNVSFDEESILSIMALQESLHWAVGRGRSKVAIGIHDLDVVTPPFHYVAAERTHRFVPLDFKEELTLDEILDRHPKGRMYAGIVDRYPRFPLITDDLGRVLSFPPIINGELTRVTMKTRNLLLDTTGTDERAVRTAVNIICTAMAETGAAIESVQIGETSWPDLASVTRYIRAEEGNRLLGTSFSQQEMADLLQRMRYGAEPAGDGILRVQVPCYRSDIMHDWDVFEDVAIGYGYERFSAGISATFAIGKPHPVNSLAAIIRQVLAGTGFIEVIPFTLSNDQVMYHRMQRPVPLSVLRVMHPITEDHTLVRTDLLPLLLEICQFNRHRELPQRIFCVGDVVEETVTFQKLAWVSLHPGADFTEAYATADAICRELSVSYRVEESGDHAFIEGRRGKILTGDQHAGVFGEIHPAVLNAFELEHAVAAMELDLRVLPEYPGKPGTP
jgi:phenylalanyl-tRNA synthetase beta chain